MWNRFVEFMLGTPKQRRDRKIMGLYRREESLKSIARMVNLSHERVRQIVRDWSEDDEIERRLLLVIVVLMTVMLMIATGYMMVRYG